MKYFFYIIISLWFLKLNAQQVAQDFILTDVLGNTYSLYQELDKGKVVVLDFYITNCGTCQINSPILDSIWQQYGYGGDSVWVWGIETSGRNDSEIINFMQQYGVTFPCFSTLNDDVVIYVYNITYTPQYWVICPNRTYKIVAVNQIVDAISGCKQTSSLEENMLYEDKNEKFMVIDITGRIVKIIDNIEDIQNFQLNPGYYIVKRDLNSSIVRKIIIY